MNLRFRRRLVSPSNTTASFNDTDAKERNRIGGAILNTSLCPAGEPDGAEAHIASTHMEATRRWSCSTP